MVHWLEELVAEYGYLAILVGTFFEGETIMLLGGFAAHQDYLSLPVVMLVGFLGTFCGDQVWFLLARTRGQRLLGRRQRLRRRVAAATRWLERYPVLFILSFRFLYGFRTVAPVVIGLSGIPAMRFMALNLVAAIVWAVAVASLGHVFGATLETTLGELKALERKLLAAGVLLALAYAAFFTVRRILAARRPEEAAP